MISCSLIYISPCGIFSSIVCARACVCARPCACMCVPGLCYTLCLILFQRFLASVSNMYMGDEKFEAFLQKGMAKKMAMKAQAQQDAVPHPPPRFPGAQRISNGARGMTDVQTD